MELVDEKEQERLRSIYEKCGCRVLFMSIYENKGVDELKKLLHDKTTILAGHQVLVNRHLLIFYLSQIQWRQAE